jgi:putative ABC transport system permease protein
MQLWESVLIALRGLMTNKLRTALTMLGIIIGVAAVIALLSIGKGFERNFNRSIESMGTNVLWIIEGDFNIFSGPDSGASSRQVNRRQRAPEPLTMGDVRAIANPANVPDVVAVAPVYQGWPRSVIRGQIEVTNSTITGATSDYESVRNVTLAMGSFIAEMHFDRRARVAILGANVADELFEAFETPLGQTVKLNGVPFEVIGVMKEKERGLFGDENNDVLIPLSTAQTRLYKAGAFRGELKVSAIYVQVANQERMDSVSEDIDQVLREQHRIGPDDKKDFTIISQGELLQFGSSVTAALSIFLGSIAAVSLVVGGIGIMNIMLVSVTERTREIGIRKAVGAKRRDILLQFLVEAMVLSLIGGFFGIGLGYGVSALLPVLMPDFEETVVTIESVLLATSFAAVVGLFFGVYPATRAARLKPIDALRYE